MASPIATRPWRTTTSGAIRQPLARSASITRARTGRACACTARADRPSAIDEHDVVAAGMRRQMSPRHRRQGGGRGRAASDSSAVSAGRARHRKNRIAQAGKLGGKPRLIERLMHRIARAAVRQPEVEQRPGRQRSAGARKPDTRRRQSAQAVPQRSSLGGRSGGARSGGGVGHAIRPATRPGAEPARRPAGCGPALSIKPCRASQASNSGAGRRPNKSRMASASWNEVLW